MELLVQASARLPSVVEQHRFSGSGLFKRQGFKVALRKIGSSAKVKRLNYMEVQAGWPWSPFGTPMTFALLSGVHGIVASYLKRIRGVEDALNAGIAGCATGFALSIPGTPQALLQSCVRFGVFSYILENINKLRGAAEVKSSDGTKAGGKKCQAMLA